MPESSFTNAESGISFFEIVGTAGFEEVPIRAKNERAESFDDSALILGSSVKQRILGVVS